MSPTSKLSVISFAKFSDGFDENGGLLMHAPAHDLHYVDLLSKEQVGLLEYPLCNSFLRNYLDLLDDLFLNLSHN